MRILVDECVAGPLVDELRKIFDDIIYVADTRPAAVDTDVLSWAVRDGRILVTEDYDFGELVFRRHLEAEAVIIIAPATLGIDLVGDAKAVAARLDAARAILPGHLTIVERQRLRQRPLPARR